MSRSYLRNESLNLHSVFFVVISGFNDNDNMMLVIEFVVIFVLNFAMNKMVFRVDYTHARGLSVGLFMAFFYF